MGDRILAIWQGAGYYHFTSCNSDNGNPNYTANVNYPEDIEGFWTYVYYSHSKVAKRSVGFIQFGATATPQRIQHDVSHPAPNYFKFILAGNQFSYPSFNGIFKTVVYKIGPGAFIDNVDQFNAFFATQGVPTTNWDKVITVSQVTDAINVPVPEEVYTPIGGGDLTYPDEYSVSGWFKTGSSLADWSHLFRLTLNNKADN